MTNIAECIYQSCLHETQITAAESTWKIALLYLQLIIDMLYLLKNNLSYSSQDRFNMSIYKH